MLSSPSLLGLPLGLVVKGFHLNIFLAALASGILCIWPNQLSLLGFDVVDCIFVLHQFVQLFIVFNPLMETRNSDFVISELDFIVFVGSDFKFFSWRTNLIQFWRRECEEVT